MADRLPLAGKTIVITRPNRQSSAISQRLTQLGACVVKFPLIAIESPANKSLYRSQLSKLNYYHYLIFTSRNSVEMAFHALAECEAPALASIPTLPKTLQIAAVGKQTAEALEAHGHSASIVPTELFNSEALLEHQALQAVDGKFIAIIRGEGGRDLLRDTLVERGAEVDYIDVYRRVCPVDSLLPLVKCQVRGGIDIIMLTSVEGLKNLLSLEDSQALLKQTTLLVGSQRISAAVKDTGHRGEVLVADDPSDEQMISCLLSWATSS